MNEIKPGEVHTVLGRHMLADGYDLVLDLRKSKGVRLYDSLGNTFYLDFFSCFASLPIGFNHPELLEPEFVESLGLTAVNKPVNSDLYTVEMARFVETFTRIAMPSYMKYLFLVSGGALAVENALKTAMDWKVRKNFLNGMKTERGHSIIHFRDAFHGRSGYTLSMTNTFDPRKTKYFSKFKWPRIINPKVTFPLGENLDVVIKLEERALREIMKAIEIDGDNICALIIEPIQGEGGDNHYRPEFFHELRRICDENSMLFIVDEVQTGIGLTGRMWAHEHYGIEPDIIVFGKKAQVCGIMAGKRIDDVEDHVFRESSRLNSTWGGNLVDMVRSEKILEIIKRDRLVENADSTGAYFLEQLELLGSKYSQVSNIRGRGLMCAFDMPDSDKRDRLVRQVFSNKMIILPAGHRSIRFRPSLIIERNEIDEGVKIIERSLKEMGGV